MDSVKSESEPSAVPEQQIDKFDESDYSKIYEDLQEKFNKAFALSQKLFITDKTQRQTLYYYKRRNDAILDFLTDVDDDGIEQLFEIDNERLANLVAMSPDLAQILSPLQQISSNEAPETVLLKELIHADLPVYEMIPDTVNDELDTVEVNPQDTDMWIRRNYAHLVISKFKPLEIRGKGVREYVDAPNLGGKRKKKV